MAPFGWTAKKISKEEICGENDNLNRMYVEDMMKTKKGFFFDREDKKYKFSQADGLWDEDVNVFLTVELPNYYGRLVSTLECFDDGHVGESTQVNHDRCRGKQFFHVENITPGRQENGVTEQECKQLNEMFSDTKNEWGAHDSPRMTFPENAPKGGLCIAQRSVFSDQGNPQSTVHFLWNKDNI